MKRKARSKTETTRSYTAPALDKGLDIIELLAAAPEPLALSQIAEKLGRNMSEIYRITKVLVQRNYVGVETSSEKYYLTMRLFRVTHNQAPVKRLALLGTPILKRLAQEVMQSCHIVIISESNALVIAQQDSPTNRGLGVRIGATAPLLETCSGTLLFSYSSNEIKRILLNNIEAETEQRPDEAELTKLSEKVKRKGYHQVISRQIAGVTDIGMPIFDHNGTIIAAMIVPFLKRIDGLQKASIPETRSILKTYARELSMALGAPASIFD